jgi:PAT family beta-lactamase induction signal transducer AmpG
MAMGVMANPFYLDLGFSKKEIADITKLFGFVMTIVGTSFGGLLVVRFGVLRPLLLGAVMSSSTNLLFAFMAQTEPSLTVLATVISADNLGGGIAAAAFIAYLSGLTHSAYTATQYALFSSLMTLPAKMIGSFSGLWVASYGYAVFFVYSALLGIPAIALVLWLMRETRPIKDFNQNLAVIESTSYHKRFFSKVCWPLRVCEHYETRNSSRI